MRAEGPRTAPMEPAIAAQNLSKSFRKGAVAVNGLDLAIAPGVVYGLIGRNGAGKTTTLRLLMGLLKPDSGTARVLGADLWEASSVHRQRVAYVSQSQQSPDWMSVTDLGRYARRFYTRWDPDLAADLARRWELPTQLPTGRMSGGQQRLAAILVALAARPDVLLLDEPAAGLDPIAREWLNTCLVETLLQTGCTILLSSHLISDLERLATHVGIMDRGRIVQSGEVEDWQRTLRRVQVVFAEPGPPRDFAIPGAIRTQVLGPVVTAIARIANEEQIALLQAIPGTRVNVFPLSLEETFVALFRDPASPPGGPG